ncbi:hypothetical protein IG631_24310 [Alternaria alternata]|nr:hypothetical protein IG631_24310 [Alternaria alternata]
MRCESPWNYVEAYPVYCHSMPSLPHVMGLLCAVACPAASGSTGEGLQGPASHLLLMCKKLFKSRQPYNNDRRSDPRRQQFSNSIRSRARVPDNGANGGRSSCAMGSCSVCCRRPEVA